MVSYGHIRTKYAPEWKETFDGTDDMVNQTGVIGVTDKIYNDMIAYSKTSEVMQFKIFCNYSEKLKSIPPSHPAPDRDSSRLFRQSQKRH